MIVRRLGLTVFLAVAFTCGFCTPRESTVAAGAHLQFAMQDVCRPIPKGNGKDREAHLRLVLEVGS